MRDMYIGMGLYIYIIIHITFSPVYTTPNPGRILYSQIILSRSMHIIILVKTATI